MRKITIIIILAIIALSSCNKTQEPIKKENILDSLFAKFQGVENISYISKIYSKRRKDTVITNHFFSEHKDSSGYILSFNEVAFLKGRLFYQNVYNAAENKLYYHSKDGYTVTNYNNLEEMKYMPMIHQISFSLISLVKYLNQTQNIYPKRVIIKDTFLHKKDCFLIKYNNPMGMPLDNTPIPMPESIMLKDTSESIMLIVDKYSAIPVHISPGISEWRIENVIFNPNLHDSIWSDKKMPLFFKTKVKPFEDIEEKYLLNKGTIIPKWNFITLNNKLYINSNKKKFHLIVFFTKTCGACFAEIPKLNKLNRNKNIHVTGVFFGDGEAELPEIIKKYNVKYEIVINDDKNLTRQLKRGAFPINYLVNKKEEILYSSLGNLPNLETEILKSIK